jgi:hypothetical protein
MQTVNHTNLPDQAGRRVHRRRRGLRLPGVRVHQEGLAQQVAVPLQAPVVVPERRVRVSGDSLVGVEAEHRAGSRQRERADVHARAHAGEHGARRRPRAERPAHGGLQGQDIELRAGEAGRCRPRRDELLRVRHWAAALRAHVDGGPRGAGLLEAVWDKRGAKKRTWMDQALGSEYHTDAALSLAAMAEEDVVVFNRSMLAQPVVDRWPDTFEKVWPPSTHEQKIV